MVQGHLNLVGTSTMDPSEMQHPHAPLHTSWGCTLKHIPPRSPSATKKQRPGPGSHSTAFKTLVTLFHRTLQGPAGFSCPARLLCPLH